MEGQLPCPCRHRRNHQPNPDLTGIRKARYTGLGKVHLEHVFAATAINLVVGVHQPAEKPQLTACAASSGAVQPNSVQIA